MLNIHSNKIIGETFKTLRVQKGFSQRRLIYSNDNQHICDIRTLQRFESGTHAIRKEILVALLDKLGISIEQFADLVHKTAYSNFNSDYVMLWDLISRQKNNEAYMFFNEFKTKDYCDMSNLLIAQSMLFIEGILAKRIHSDLEKSKTCYYQAIALTAKEILISNETLNINKIAPRIFSIIEHRILRAIAISYIEFDDLITAKAIFEAIIKSMEDAKTPYEIRRQIMLGTYFNYSNLLLEQEQFEDVLTVACKGLELCYSINEFALLGNFLGNKGLALYKLGDTEEALPLCKEAYLAFSRAGFEQKAEKFKTVMEQEHGVFF